MPDYLLFIRLADASYRERMKILFFPSMTLVLTLSYVLAVSASENETVDITVQEISRIAASNVASLLKARELLEAGELDDLRELINARLAADLAYLQLYDGILSSDKNFSRLRDKIVPKLKQLWLREPPEFLNEESIRFIEDHCKRLQECPVGELSTERAAH
jgi:hypothetical protein